MYRVDKLWSEKLMPEVGDLFRAYEADLNFTTHLSNNPRQTELKAQTENSQQTHCVIDQNGTWEIRKIIIMRHSNEAHYKVETRTPEWKGPVYATLLRIKRNGTIEPWTMLHKRSGRTRDEAEASNITIEYPFHEFQELDVKRNDPKINVRVTGLPTTTKPSEGSQKPDSNLEEQLSNHMSSRESTSEYSGENTDT